MAYEPPVYDDINFNLLSGYTPPVYNNINLDIVIGGDIVVDAPAFGQGTVLDSDLVWFSPAQEFGQDSAFDQIAIAFSMHLPGFSTTNTIDISTARRIGLLNFEQGSTFGPEFISVVPEDTTVVGVWPFESHTGLDRPDFSHVLAAEFNQNSGLSTPIITASGIATMSPPDFENTADFSSGIMPGVTVFDFENTGQLDILAIRYMPDGDQYTVCPPFEQTSEFEIPVFQAGFTLPDFEQGSALDAGPIYDGIVVSPVTFVSVSDLNATPHPGVYLSDFNSYQTLGSDIMPAVSVLDFEQVSGLFADIQTGVFVEIPEFNSRITIDVVTFFELPLTDFEQDSALEGFDISEFISVPEFNVNGELLIDKINVFTLEFSQIRYFLTITGVADGVDDVQIPCTSFQARRRSGADTYLQAVVPSTGFIDQITARANGTMRIDQAYVLGDEVLRSKTIIETTMDQINPYEGGASDSLVLIGYKTTTYTPKTVVVTDATYRAQIDGKLSYRLPTPDLLLNPGDHVIIGYDEFTLGVMSYTVSGDFQQIDLTEA